MIREGFMKVFEPNYIVFVISFAVFKQRTINDGYFSTVFRGVPKIKLLLHNC